MKYHRPIVLALCVALAACDQQGGDKSAPAGSGEVLPGSISDDMIDLDTSTAAPPLAPAKAKAAAKSAPDASSAASEPEPAAAAAAEAPAESSGRTE
ncbi:hypothetical protein [Novosphingobium sp.]|uniref:hypothetical protein n=1 Tax=Novosphingobium sp. TaxID=1874826 RepID=UPI002631CCF0|nr:hypothetical protein [Novosphingobium sp.]